jgi:hypothetical protein
LELSAGATTLPPITSAQRRLAITAFIHQ